MNAAEHIVALIQSLGLENDVQQLLIRIKGNTRREADSAELDFRRRQLP